MNTWQQSDAGALWTRVLDNGQLAAIWAYTDTLGTFYKLLTDSDRGDYITLGAAMRAAAELEIATYELAAV